MATTNKSNKGKACQDSHTTTYNTKSRKGYYKAGRKTKEEAGGMSL